MHILQDFALEINGDQVLKAQGADPFVIRARRPRLAALADEAVRIGRPLLQPAVALHRFQVQAVRHEKIILDGGGSLSGALVAQQLGAARQIVLAVCTIGTAVETYAYNKMNTDPAFGLALDGFGSAAAEALANAACQHLSRQAEAEGVQATIPFGPGMEGWPVESGQRQIFTLLDAAQIGVSLNASSIMTPRKSVTFAVGFGPEVTSAGRPCDFCSLKQTCRYRPEAVDEDI